MEESIEGASYIRERLEAATPGETHTKRQLVKRERRAAVKGRGGMHGSEGPSAVTITPFRARSFIRGALQPLYPERAPHKNLIFLLRAKYIHFNISSQPFEREVSPF